MYLRLDKHLLVEGVSKDGYEVDIKHYNNDFTRPLPTDGNKDERVNEIKSIMPKNDNSIINLAIVDIEPYHSNDSTKNYDPKQLIRSTFKDNRILTQFINYNNDTIIQVIMNSIKDLISAAGFMDDYLYKNIGIENNDILVGINKVSGGDNENILAMTKIEKGRTYINIYGIDKWMMLDECIFTINKSFINKVKIQKILPATKTGVNDWIVSNLSNILKSKNKVYTFIDANIRMNLWTFAQNKRFNKVNLENLSLINKEKLRLIRVNYTDEIPEYFIYDEKKNNINKSSGIFKSDKNTYYLVGKRQETDQANNSWTKCDKPNKPLRKPSIYEVNIIGCEDEEELDSIAQITQLLRMMNISYDSHASLPLPMYITKRLSEYILAEKSK
ncbi:RNaseH domain-containing protein [Romboutsia hominis]|uniref:RNaseH domain-containing protein n=2 Tax=Romboutsia hominis TaxID=1507512 RepID=UPI0023DD2D38|nr:RNaseH domain-containing protein [Romboutsia hominis]